MNYFQAKGTIEILSNVFGIPTPELRWSDAETRGHAFHLLHRISIGPKIAEWKSLEDTVLHEFTHILVYCRTPRVPEALRANMRRPHGEIFQKTLIEVILAWYGDLSRYDFKGSEYVSVAKGVQKIRRKQNETNT